MNKEDIVITPPTSPDVYEVYIEGKPDVDYRIEGGIYLWKTANIWNIRFARPITTPRPIVEGTIFSGFINIEQGLIINLITQNISPRNTVRIRGGNTIIFNFDIREKVEGFEFTVKPINTRYCITVDIKIDGIHNPELLRLGKFMHRPDYLPLRICIRKT